MNPPTMTHGPNGTATINVGGRQVPIKLVEWRPLCRLVRDPLKIHAELVRKIPSQHEWIVSGLVCMPDSRWAPPDASLDARRAADDALGTVRLRVNDKSAFELPVLPLMDAWHSIVAPGVIAADVSAAVLTAGDEVPSGPLVNATSAFCRAIGLTQPWPIQHTDEAWLQFDGTSSRTHPPLALLIGMERRPLGA